MCCLFKKRQTWLDSLLADCRIQLCQAWVVRLLFYMVEIELFFSCIVPYLWL